MPSLSLKKLFGRWIHAKQSEPQLPITGLSASRQAFDLSKVQEPETIRRHKRKKLLRWSLPCALLVGIVALWFLLPTPLTHQAIGSYKHQNYRSARHWITPLTWTSPERWITKFNSGTIDTQLGNYTVAQAELTKALELAPADKRCMVVQNLVISLTLHSASIKATSTNQNTSVYDNEAASLKTNNPKCFKISTPPPKKKGGGGGGGGGAQQQSKQILSPAQAEELQQKNQQGQQSQQQDFLQSAVDPNNPNVKPW